MMDSHEKIERLLAAPRELEESERRAVAAHLRHCAACAARAASYARMDEQLRQLGQRDRRAVGALQTGALPRAHPEAPRRATRLLGGLRRASAGLATVATLLLLTVALVWLLGGSPEAGAGTGDDPPTVVVFEAPNAQYVLTVVTATPPAPLPPPVATTGPEGAQSAFRICTAGEPSTLRWDETAYLTQLVLEAVQESLVETRRFGYQPNLVEALPSEEAGTLLLESVELSAGDRFYDSRLEQVRTLVPGMTEALTIPQLAGPPLALKGWDGSAPLPAVRATARWTLVEGLRWQDGLSVTADDSVFAFELERAAEAPSLFSAATQSYRALDARTVEWQGLPGFFDPSYPTYVRDPLPRRHYAGVEALADSDLANRAPPSYGPFQIDRWVPGEALYLSRNPHYVNGPAQAAALLFRFVPESSTLLAQLVSGDCDVASNGGSLSEFLPLARSFEAEGLLNIQQQPGLVFEHLDFNLEPAEGYSGAAATLRDASGGRLFANPDFRRAVALCLNRDALISEALAGLGFPQAGYLPATHPLHPDDAAITRYPFDPSAARALLAGLGWSDTDGDGLLDDGRGQPLAFRYATRSSPTRERVTQQIQAQLRDQCGIEVGIDLMGAELFMDAPDGAIFGRRYDVAEFAWLTGPDPACTLYTSAAIPSAANGWQGSNNMGFADAAFDAACAAALAATEPTAQAAHHAEALARFTDQLPSIPLYNRATIAIASPRVTGFELDPTMLVETWNAENFALQGP